MQDGQDIGMAIMLVALVLIGGLVAYSTVTEIFVPAMDSQLLQVLGL